MKNAKHLKKLKIAFIFGSWSIGNRPLDFNNLWTSSRGLTGSDLGITITASEMALLGHEVSLYTKCVPNQPKVWEDVQLFDVSELPNLPRDCDVVISWSEPDQLRFANPKALRVCCQMLNDFTYAQPGFDDFVDVWTAPCQMHLDFLQTKIGNKEKWNVLPLGCEPSWYKNDRKPGRVVWTSSADRGLHWLLQEWPAIKKAVPAANLRVFYNFDYSTIIGFQPDDDRVGHHIKEMAQRARYMLEAMKRLAPLDVQAVGSISRQQMAQELSEAMVLGYSCDTVAFTEGFSVSILESCAAGVYPVITDNDCLGSIYGGVVPMVKSPIRDNLKDFRDLVITGLTNDKKRKAAIKKCRKFAKKHTWTKCTQQLEGIINANL